MTDVAAKLEVAADGDGAENAGTAVTTPAGPVDSNPVSPKATKGEDGANGDAKSDSEAETVVLPGKDDATASPRRKAIKHEGNEKPSKRVSEGISDKTKKDNPDRDGEAKGKKNAKEHNHTATSSNLSSTRSSPVPEARTSSRAGSEALQSKSKGQADSDSVSRASQSRKRKMASEDTDDKSHKRRQKRDGSLENAASSKAADGERREKSKSNAARSESPQPRTRNRAQSLKGSTGNPPTTQRRKKPPPLAVSARSKNHDDDSGSDGSTSPRGGGSHLKRLVSGDASATSPAKMPSHKKLLDRNGRTWLARACDSEDPSIVRDRIQERPEELDIADYAHNTPLQIASLKGRHEIVKVLLEAGCKLDVKNIDQDTPLIDAVENGHLKVIKLLLAAGVNPRQSNAEGEDVMDLLDPEGDDYDEIKKLLTKARESRRRTSDDPQAPHTGKESVHAHSPREASLNSPPPLPTGSRRRTARSEATRNDLLWVNATSQNLQNKARVGDDAAVDHILNMNPGCADIYSVLAATRGSHEVSLSLILAIGRPPADPDPIPGERGSQSTPMLAAIGRGNLRVIELLLEQPGFDPTRRLYQNKPYHEISKDRRGPQWDDEYRALKRAYDKAKGRISSGSSPSATKKSKAENAGSPSQERTKSQAEQKDGSKDVAVRKKSATDSKSAAPRADEKSPERSRQHTKKHLRVPSKPSSREASIAVSDREASPLRKSSEKKSRRSLSDTEETEVQKPRKRLMSRRDLAEGNRQRRESMASVGSASSKDDTKARLAREQSGSQKIKREESKREESRTESKSSKTDAGKKRSRLETTSPDDKIRDSQTSPEATKKAKRLRVDAEGKPRKSSEADGAASRQKSPSVSAARAIKGKDGSKASKDAKSSSRNASPAPGSAAEKPSVTKIKEEEADDPSSQLQKEAQEAAETEKKEKAVKKEAERVAREEAAAKEAETRKREEAERKQKAEKEEAERKAKAEKEEAERKAREEEEARAEKKRQEEERARQVAERERIRKEQEELQARRRKEQEEKERLAREKKQQEEERRRRELLPNALRIAAELSPEQAKQPSEIRHWLPLYTAEGHQLDASTDDSAKRELWVTNIQAAPVLGLTDLDLSQYTAWNKRSANDSQRLALWRILRRKLARYQAPELGPADHQEEFRLDTEAHEKYDALKNVFWIRLSDLLDIVPRYPHLASIDLKCCPIAIRAAPKPEPSAQVSPTAVPNGLPGRPSLPNGYH